MLSARRTIGLVIVWSAILLLFWMYHTGTGNVISVKKIYDTRNFVLEAGNMFTKHKQETDVYRKNMVHIRNRNVAESWGCGSKYEWAEYLGDLFSRYKQRSDFGIMINCTANIDDVTGRIEKVLHYPIKVQEKHETHLSLGKTSSHKPQLECYIKKSQIPVFVTASTSRYFMFSQTLLKNLDDNVRSKHKNMKLIFYDLGLEARQRRLIKSYCIKMSMCEFRIFEFDRYPDHVRWIHGYAFKPIIIQEVIQEHDFVFWLDASIRLTGNLTELISRTEERGIQVLPNGGNLAQRTGNKTFLALGENPCYFYHYPEIGAGAIIVIRNNFTMNAILRPWTMCALSYGCMVYSESEMDLKTNCESKHYHSCHRFDQSVLSVILARLYSRHMNLIFMDFKPKLQTVIDVQRSIFYPYFCHLFKLNNCE